MDGVIVDNTPYHIRAWKAFCKQYDIVLDEDKYLKHVNGRTMREATQNIFNRPLSAEEIIKYTEEKEGIYRELYRPDIRPAQGLLAFLEHLAANDVSRAIATSATAVNVDFVVKATGIERYFDIILDENSIIKGKPDPEIYLKTARALGKEPSHCVVFEDSISGIQAAINAGTKVVGLATTHPEEMLTNVDMVIKNFDNMTMKKLESLFTI